MRSNLAFIKKRVALATSAGAQGGGTDVVLKWNTLTGGTLDPTTNSLVGATAEPQTETVKALLHFIGGSFQVREFVEIEVGDCIADFAATVTLEGRTGLYFEFNGAQWEQKPMSDRLAEMWDTVVKGQRLFRTVLLKKRA